MWVIEETTEVRKLLEKDFKSGRITRDDIIVIKKWYADMEKLGPEAVMSLGKYDDHHLDGDWHGHRSACFSPSGRIIYTVVEDKILVKVVRITPDHNYIRRP